MGLGNPATSSWVWMPANTGCPRGGACNASGPCDWEARASNLSPSARVLKSARTRTIWTGNASALDGGRALDPAVYAPGTYRLHAPVERRAAVVRRPNFVRHILNQRAGWSRREVEIVIPGEVGRRRKMDLVQRLVWLRIAEL